MSYNGEDPRIVDLLSGFSAMNRMLAAGIEGIRREYGVSERGAHILGRIGVGQRYPSELAAHLKVSSSLISFELEKLEGAGFITREADPDDGRRMRLTLSDEGDIVQSRIIERAARLLSARLERLPAKERRAFMCAMAIMSAD